MQPVHVRFVAFWSGPVLDTHQSDLHQCADVLSDCAFGYFALLCDVLVAWPAFAGVAGVVGQLDEHKFSQGIANLGFHRLDHQLHAHRWITLAVEPGVHVQSAPHVQSSPPWSELLVLEILEGHRPQEWIRPLKRGT